MRCIMVQEMYWLETTWREGDWYVLNLDQVCYASSRHPDVTAVVFTNGNEVCIKARLAEFMDQVAVA